MALVGKTVFTVNAKTNKVDAWVCYGELTGLYHGKKERLCLLRRERFMLVLPKRCVFETEENARAVLKSGK